MGGGVDENALVEQRASCPVLQSGIAKGRWLLLNPESPLELLKPVTSVLLPAPASWLAGGFKLLTLNRRQSSDWLRACQGRCSPLESWTFGLGSPVKSWISQFRGLGPCGFDLFTPFFLGLVHALISVLGHGTACLCAHGGGGRMPESEVEAIAGLGPIKPTWLGFWGRCKVVR